MIRSIPSVAGGLNCNPQLITVNCQLSLDVMPAASDLVELAWGDQPGFVALSVRDQNKDKLEPGYWKDHIFKWPSQRKRVRKFLDDARSSKLDVYWAPAVFSERSRSAKAVTALNMLWADLDEAEPDRIPNHLKPTAVWESSPGRYQAVWKMTETLNPSDQQRLNQRLTYAIGADRGGWDLTQVLRIPGTHNHKYEDEPKVRLLYLNGHTLDPGKVLHDLPEVATTQVDAVVLPPFVDVVAERKSQFSSRVKQLLRAKNARVGERSDRLWELECLLAEQGLSAEEIASIARETVWNKFRTRHDEVSRLLLEAQKAVGHAGPTDEDEVWDTVEEELKPQAWGEFDRVHKPIRWLVADVWAESEVGFISGLPKSYKSWVALDLAVSVATGTRFLNTFQTHRSDVLLVQEEDPRPVLQDRLVKIAAAKDLIKAEFVKRELWLTYELPDSLHVVSNQGFTLTEEWLEQLERWILEREVKLVILDPLMMIAGAGFDEFKAFDFMEKVLKPLKRLRAHTGAAVTLVHHHLKGSSQGGARDMYGSVALWAWEESALHLQVASQGKVTAERFSKHALLQPLTVEIGDVSEVWAPRVSLGAQAVTLIELLGTMETGATVEELCAVSGQKRDAVVRQLKSAEQSGEIVRSGTQKRGPGRPTIVWRTA